MADRIGTTKTKGKPAPFDFQQSTQALGAPSLTGRPPSAAASLPSGALVPSRQNSTEPQFRSSSAARGGALNSSAAASQPAPTPLGHLRGIPIFWGEACGNATPAGIVLRTGSITESQAQLMLIPSQGGTFDAIRKQLGASDQKKFDAAAKTASERAQANGAGAFPHTLSLSNAPREIILVKVPKEDEKNAAARMALALTDAATAPALKESKHTSLATTWLGAGKADAGNIYSQAQLNTLCDWLLAQPGRSVEICDIEPKRFSPLCQYLANPASLPEAEQSRSEVYADWMRSNDSQIRSLGSINGPKPILVWAFGGKQGKENTAAIQGKTGLILAFDTDAMKVADDTAFLYAHKAGLAIGKKGMAGHLRTMAAGTDFVDVGCHDALKAAAADGKNLKPAQAVLVNLPANTGQLRGKAIILVNGPYVGSGPTTPEDASNLETAIDNAFAQAVMAGVRSVTVTGISTGEFGFDKVWGGNIITQAAMRALQSGKVDTVIVCFWHDKGLSLQESVPGGALTAVLTNPLFEPV